MSCYRSCSCSIPLSPSLSFRLYVTIPGFCEGIIFLLFLILAKYITYIRRVKENCCTMKHFNNNNNNNNRYLKFCNFSFIFFFFFFLLFDFGLHFPFIVIYSLFIQPYTWEPLYCRLRITNPNACTGLLPHVIKFDQFIRLG